MSAAAIAREALVEMGVSPPAGHGQLAVDTPIDGSRLTNLPETPAEELEAMVAAASAAFLRWRVVPAPVRGELVRRLGLILREHKQALGRLVSIDTGKILSEGTGEVQEMIDMADFAVGLSRQLHGLTIASERPGHAMRETWHPIGPVLIISAFNFPVAVWAWNAFLALICGNPVIWKPSEKAMLSAFAVHALLERVIAEFDAAPAGLSALALGPATTGARLVGDKRIALISATGSTGMGLKVAAAASERFARVLLELGGNNAAIVTPSADLDTTLRAILFSAVGTAGQRCTTLRRLIVHESVYPVLREKLSAAFDRLPIGNPLESGILVGPLIDRAAFEAMQGALEAARAHGGIVRGGERIERGVADAFYVRPALVEMPRQCGPMLEETFAPILYLIPYCAIDEAVALQNDSAHGLSSAIFTSEMREAETFLSAAGSDCGIANVNIGTSGAEIGGAFGGEKATGGGRESGSDSWRAYMRRQTATLNYSRELPLAQGVRFDL
jgi:aldehyde dehydrogenase (NAD+)